MSDEIDEVLCRISILEEQVDNLMKYCKKLSYLSGIPYNAEKEGEQY